MKASDIRMCARLLEQSGQHQFVKEINKINRRMRARRAFTIVTVAYIIGDVYTHKYVTKK